MAARSRCSTTRRRSRGRIDSPFVGRRDELAQLVAAFARAVEEGAAQRVTLLGVPGIGKSRLARELVQQVAGEARIAVGRCLAYGEGITYWPLAEIVRATAGADRDAIGAVAGDEVAADRVAAAIGVGGVAGTKEETQWAARRYLEALAAERPLVVVLDDLHWAEPTFLDLVEYVADFAAAPILLLCTARPDLLAERPAWTAPRPNAVVLALEPLADDDAAALAGDVDEQTRRRILEVAEGNPLFVEQLAALRADGADGLDVPPTMQALLAARIDSLAPPERIVVERASIEGRLFHRGSVVELAPEDVRPDVGAHLLALVRKEFVRPDRAQLPGDDGYRFAHVLVRDAAYESMAKELRAELHERFADLARARRRRPARRAGGDPRLPPRAGGLLPARARPPGRDRRRTASGGAAGPRGHACLRPRRPDRGGEPPRARGVACCRRAIRCASGRCHCSALRSMAPRAGWSARSRSSHRRSRRAARRGDRAAEASAWALHQLVAVRSVPGTDIERIHDEVCARTPRSSGSDDARALVFLCRLELEIAIILARRRWTGRLSGCSQRPGRRRPSECASGPSSSSHACRRVRADAGRRGARATQGRFRALAEGPLEEAAVEHIEGLLRGMRGELDEGLPTDPEVPGDLRRVRPEVHRSRDRARRGLDRRYAGDAAAAERASVPPVTSCGRRARPAVCRRWSRSLADALYELGRYDEAEEATGESERLTQQEDVASQVIWRRVRAKLLARRGERDEALRVAREAIEWAGTDLLEQIGDAYRDLAEVERLAGRADAAAEALERALAAYEQKGSYRWPSGLGVSSPSSVSRPPRPSSRPSPRSRSSRARTPSSPPRRPPSASACPCRSRSSRSPSP